jgi:uncharacterized membrane protein YcaP (DUF421 family)
MQVATSYLAFRSKRARRILEGNPIVIIQDGAFVTRNLRRERMTVDEVSESMRLEQIGSVEQVEWGILESNGSISFIPKS